jgi:teichuronic acid biosynthesis glycosyltransferase TuaG
MLVSVIIPYFEKKKYINKTVNSILKQTYKQFEIIIINDEITSSSKALLSKIKKRDRRIKIINNKKNIGAGYSRNKGIKLSKGKFIAFIDSDDLWKKNKLKDQISFMTKFNYKVSHSAYEIISKNGKKLALRKSKNLNFRDLMNSCDIGLSTVIIEKKILSKSKNFPNLKTKEDYFLWLSLSKKGEIFYYLNKSLTFWRVTQNSLSSSVLQKITDSLKVYNFFEKNFVTSFLRSIILTLNYIKKKINDTRNY